MWRRGWVAVAAIMMAGAGGGANAATEAEFTLASTGDLVDLCSAAPDNGVGSAALNFCEGYVQGAVTVEMLNLAAFSGSKLFCLPSPPPTRSQATAEFVVWARAEPARLTQSPTDGLFGYLRERYPCPPSR
jgi:Rap1a immunity proteins